MISLAFIESQIVLPVLISSKKSFSYKSDPVWVRRYNQLEWMYLWINYNDLKNGSVDAEIYNYMYDLMNPGRFAPKPFPPLVVSPPRRFPPGRFAPLVVSPH